MVTKIFVLNAVATASEDMNNKSPETYTQDELQRFWISNTQRFCSDGEITDEEVRQAVVQALTLQ